MLSVFLHIITLDSVLIHIPHASGSNSCIGFFVRYTNKFPEINILMYQSFVNIVVLVMLPGNTLLLCWFFHHPSTVCITSVLTAMLLYLVVMATNL